MIQSVWVFQHALIPYGMYIKEKSRSYKKNIKHAKNWDYDEKDDCFICPNGRRVAFKRYLNKKNASGFVQSFNLQMRGLTPPPLGGISF